MHLVKLAGVTYLAPWVCPTPVASSDIEDTSRLQRGLIPYFLCCVLLLLFWLVGFSFCFVLFCIFFCLPLKFLPLYHGHAAVYQWSDCRIYCSFFFSSFLKKKKKSQNTAYGKKNGVVSGIYRPLSIWFCVTLQAYLKLYSKKIVRTENCIEEPRAASFWMSSVRSKYSGHKQTISVSISWP